MDVRGRMRCSLRENFVDTGGFDCFVVVEQYKRAAVAIATTVTTYRQYGSTGYEKARWCPVC